MTSVERGQGPGPGPGPAGLPWPAGRPGQIREAARRETEAAPKEAAPATPAKEGATNGKVKVAAE